MKPYPCKIHILGFLITLAALTEAQEYIVISDSLAANAEILNVNMGDLSMGKIQHFQLGDYAIVSSKGMGVTKGSTKENIIGTKKESVITRKFSFILKQHTSDSAMVQAEYQKVVQSHQANVSLPHFFRGNKEVKESDSFTAWISINGDTSSTWTLYMRGTSGSHKEDQYETFLLQGERKIMLMPASSNMDFDFSKPFWFLKKLPAMGCEFIENGLSLGALQYFGGGLLGISNKNKQGFGCLAWMHKRSDVHMKLTLAAAMTAMVLMNNPYSPIQNQ